MSHMKLLVGLVTLFAIPACRQAAVEVAAIVRNKQAAEDILIASKKAAQNAAQTQSPEASLNQVVANREVLRTLLQDARLNQQKLGNPSQRQKAGMLISELEHVVSQHTAISTALSHKLKVDSSINNQINRIERQWHRVNESELGHLRKVLTDACCFSIKNYLDNNALPTPQELQQHIWSELIKAMILRPPEAAIMESAKEMRSTIENILREPDWDRQVAETFVALCCHVLP